jgi:hypothetical protein
MFNYLIIFILVFAHQVIGLEPTAIYLTWKEKPDTTMIIRWLTPIDSSEVGEDAVVYQESGAGHPSMQSVGSKEPLPSKAPFLLHSTELIDLKPDTTYTFRIGKEGVPHKFRTMERTLTHKLTFVAGGDMYHDSIETLNQTNRAAAGFSPAFALLGGDLAYQVGSYSKILPLWAREKISFSNTQSFDRWLQWLISWQNEMVTPDGRFVPILPAIGNHDVNGGFGQTPAQAPFFYALFPMPGQQGYNVLDMGNYLSIIILDSGHTHPIEGAQSLWLEGALKAREDKPYKFALYHVPAYPSARPFEYQYSQDIQKAWVPIFDRYRLTAAFENHDHDYKRTFPLQNGKIAKKGVVYIGDGAWGVEDPREVKDEKRKKYLAKYASKRHFLVITIDGNGQTVEAVDPAEDVECKCQVFDRYHWK